jgi:hypothetical protein
VGSVFLQRDGGQKALERAEFMRVCVGEAKRVSL